MVGPSLNLCTFNVNGMGEAVKRKAIFKKLRDLSNDICLLQETHSTPSTQQLWTNEWGGSAFFSHGSRSSRGVAIMMKRGLNYKMDQIVVDIEGRYIILKLEIDNSEIVIGNIYAPTQDKESEQLVVLGNFIEQLSEFRDLPLLLGGDFNLALDPSMDKRTPSKNDHSKRYREAVRDFMRAYELVDFWREQNPKMHRYTFHRKKQSTRIDYWLITDFIKNAVKGCRIEVGFLSDHSMVTLKLNEGNKAIDPCSKSQHQPITSLNISSGQFIFIQ